MIDKYRMIQDARDALLVDQEQIRQVFHRDTKALHLSDALARINGAVQELNRWLMENQEIKDDGKGNVRPETSTAATA